MNHTMAVVQAKRKPKDRDSNFEVYALGGFSLKDGALSHVERWSFDTQEWEERAPMNLRRINAAAVTVQTATGHHLYVFGGRGEGDEFHDTVERYSCDLDFWNMLEIRLPRKLCNHFVFPFNSGVTDNFIVFGGVRPKDLQSLGTKGVETEIERNVYMFNRSKEVWYQLRPLPDTHKLSHAVHAGNGKFYLYLLAQRQDQPTVAVYDLKEKCPKLDRYWEYARLATKEDCLNEDQPLLEFYGRESSQAMPGEVVL